MLEPTSTCIHKSIFHIIRNPEFSSDTDIQETIDSIICDYLHRCYAVSIEPSQLRRGLLKSNDETCSIRSAFVYPDPSNKEFSHWATLIRIHDAALRRRNWTVRIGLTQQDASSATLYHAVSYSDHQAGSFSVFRPPVLTPPLLPQLLLSHPTAGCNGCGWKANVSYTLNTIDRHAVCYQDTVGALCAADWRGPNSQYVGADKLICTDARGNGNGQVCANVTGDHENRVTDYTNIITYGGDKAGTLDASYYKGAGARNGKEREFVAERKSDRKYIVRRLSTTECARLQGLPDCWAIPVHKEDMTDEEAAFWEDVRKTHAAINGTRYKPFSKREQLVRWYNRLHTDSAEYKLYGNGIALPCAVYVLRGIAQELSEEKSK